MSWNKGEKTNDKLKEKQPLQRWRRILLYIVLIAIVLLSFLVLGSYIVGRQLGAEIVKISQAGEPITFSDLESDIIPSSTGEDAAQYYNEALLNIPVEELTNLKLTNTLYRDNIASLPESEFPDDLREEVAQSLVHFQPVLEKLDKAAGIPLSRFDIGIQHGIEACRNRLLQLQTTAFLLSLQTLDLIQRGEGDIAVDSVISMLKMTRTLDLYPTLVLHVSKISFVLFACEDIRLLLEHSRPSEKSLAELQKVLLETIPANALEKAFFAERVYQIEAARNLIPEDISSRLLAGEVPDLPERLSLPTAFWMRLWLRRRSMQYLRGLAWLITASRRPWPGPLDTIVAKVSESKRASSKVVSSGAAFAHVTAEALVFVRCTMLAVAIERYRSSQGKTPGSLEDILTTCINSIPLDTFTGTALLYNQDEEGYVVYSVGINRQDDGGSTAPKNGETSPQDRGLRINFSKSE